MESSPYHVTKMNMFNYNLNKRKLFKKGLFFNNYLELFQINLDFPR